MGYTWLGRDTEIKILNFMHLGYVFGIPAVRVRVRVRVRIRVSVRVRVRVTVTVTVTVSSGKD